MARTRIVARATATTQIDDGTIALIASGPGSERIVEILDAGNLKTVRFELAERVGGEPPTQPACSAVALWLEDAGDLQPHLIESLTQRLPGTPLVLVCGEIERWEMRAALAAGAAGVVLDEDLDSALIPCLQAVQAGQTCVPRDHWRQIDPPALSSREKQILGLVVMGYMNSQIAEQLFLAESTVKSHLSSAFGKLGVRSRNEAVSLILDPERGLGMGILSLGGEPLESTGATR
jgi:DNA-binding NarL/FixJ family response regulator